MRRYLILALAGLFYFQTIAIAANFYWRPNEAGLSTISSPTTGDQAIVGTSNGQASFYYYNGASWVGSTLIARGFSIQTSNGDNLVLTDTSDAYSGIGTATLGSPRLFVGRNTPSGDDSAILVGRNISGNGLFSHAIRDESTFSSGPTDSAYASFDSNYTVTGSLDPYNHFGSFQSRITFNGTGSVDQVIGFNFQGYGTGDIDSLFGIKIQDYAGTGTVGAQVGLWIDDLSGGTANYAIYSNGDAPSYHGGFFQTGGDILAAGNITGANLGTSSISGYVGVGDGVGEGVVSSFIGHNSGASMSSGVYNTFLGAFAGEQNTTGDNNVLVGSYAGNSLTGSGNVFIGANSGSSLTSQNNTFWLANSTTTEPLVYGRFDTGLFQVNGSIRIREKGSRPSCDSDVRGTFWVTEGGAGVKDALDVCLKDATNAYAWRSIY